MRAYCVVGDVFDPNIHEVLFEMEDPKLAASTIGSVFRTGYKLNDRVIRYACVVGRGWTI